MDLPIIDPPIFPRWVWIEEITYSHIPIATMITAIMVMAPIFEYVGYRWGDERFDRLAKGLIWWAMILFSPGAALGTGIPMWIMGTYPEFWSRWSNLFFWPLIAQFGFFMFEVIFLFFAYYLMWDKLKDNKPLHITFGAIAATFGLLVQVVWDAVGAYMLTPGRPLPMITEAVAWSSEAFFNPSFPYLFTHRFFGNLSYVMMLIGGFFALRQFRQQDESEREYYRFAADVTFTVGVLSFFAMPLIGWGYAKVLRMHAPVAFHAIMGGHVSPNFQVKMVFVVILVLSGCSYLFARFRSRGLLTFVTMGVIVTSGVFWFHPPVDGFGGLMGWRMMHTIVPAVFLAVLWVWGRRWDPRARFWSRLMFAGGVAAFCAFLIGGFVRERSRSPYTVYKEIVKPEITGMEAGRFFFYERCVMCHHENPGFFDQYRGEDWEAVLETERARLGVNLSDEEAARLVDYLEEQY